LFIKLTGKIPDERVDADVYIKKKKDLLGNQVITEINGDMHHIPLLACRYRC